MANELDFDDGQPITVVLSIANPAANATTPLAFPQGGVGFVVPTGYKYCPMYLSIESNADLTAGTATAKVTDNGTVVANGPEPALSDPVQRASAVARAGAVTIAAGRRVGVSVVTDAAYAPVTADLDAVLNGIFLPA